MASIISAGTTSATSLNMSADTSGVLQLASNNGTVALTISTSQNIGIGTSSPVGTLNVIGGLGVGAALTGDQAVTPPSGSLVLSGTNLATEQTYTSPGASTTVGQIYNYASIANSYYRYLDLVAYGSTTGAGANIRFITGVGGGSTNVERGRFDASGALLVNFTSNPYQNLNTRLAVQGGETPLWVQGTQQGYCQGSIAIASGTADGPSGRGLGVYLYNRGTTATWYMGTAYGAGDSWFVMRKTGGSFSADTPDVGLGWKMQLSSSGVAYQGNNSSTWTTTSDARIKDDVQAIENGLEVVLALRPVDFYNKITKKREENFIAQEYEQVLAKHVTREEPVGVEAEFVTDEILRLNPNLVPYLVSAIQKQQAIIEQLKADVAALKGAA